MRVCRAAVVPAKKHLRLDEETARPHEVDGNDFARYRRRQPDVRWRRAFVGPLDDFVVLQPDPFDTFGKSTIRARTFTNAWMRCKHVGGTNLNSYIRPGTNARTYS